MTKNGGSGEKVPQNNEGEVHTEWDTLKDVEPRYGFGRAADLALAGLRRRRAFAANGAKRMKSEILTSQTKKLFNGDHKGLGRSYYKDIKKAIGMVEQGNLNLDDADLVDSYVEAKLKFDETIDESDGKRRLKTFSEKLDDITGLGIPPDKPILLATQDVVSGMNKSLKNKALFYTDDNFNLNNSHTAWLNSRTSLVELSRSIEKYDVPEALELIQDNVDIQAFGDEALKCSLPEYWFGDDRTLDESRVKEVRENYAFLKKMGFVPFKDNTKLLFDENVNNCFKKQTRANQLGLLDGEVVDRMYHEESELLGFSDAYVLSTLACMALWTIML